MRHTNNEDGSTDSIVTFVSGFIFAGFMVVALGRVIDIFTKMANATAFAAAAASQMRYDTFNNQLLVFQFFPFVVLIGLIIYRVASSNRDTNEVSALSEMGKAIVWASVFQIILMAITLFGGYALDTFVFNSGGLHGAANTDLYDYVQFLPSMVYGLLFYGSLGTQIQFLLTAAKINVFAWLSEVF